MNNAKEKAQELVDKFYEIMPELYGSITVTQHLLLKSAKQAALICCDEIQKEVPRYIYGQGERYDSNEYEFWNEVKEEIKLM